MKLLIVAAVLTGVCTLAHANDAYKLAITTEAPPPYSTRDGQHAAGISTEIVRAVLDRARIDYTIDVLPWKRAYHSAVERSNGCVYATSRTPERERQFKWIGPLAEAEWVLMARSGSGLVLRSLEDARRYRIGTYNGDLRDQYLREHGFNVDAAQDELSNPRKLLLGRIDLWAASMQRGSNVLERLGYAGKIEPILIFHHQPVYLACNRAISDALVARMNAAFEAIERDGTVRTIQKRYGDRDHYEP